MFFIIISKTKQIKNQKKKMVEKWRKKWRKNGGQHLIFGFILQTSGDYIFDCFSLDFMNKPRGFNHKVGKKKRDDIH